MVMHPSAECVCCQVAWETHGGDLTFDAWLKSKQLGGAIKPKAKAPTPAPHARNEPGTICVVIDTPHVLKSDDLWLFGSGDTLTDTVHHMPVSTSFPDLLVSFGLFPSKGHAKKNGWNKPIPDGWTEVVVGKLKVGLFIWKPSE